jgi:hypothetical protein
MPQTTMGGPVPLEGPGQALWKMCTAKYVIRHILDCRRASVAWSQVSAQRTPALLSQGSAPPPPGRRRTRQGAPAAIRPPTSRAMRGDPRRPGTGRPPATGSAPPRAAANVRRGSSPPTHAGSCGQGSSQGRTTRARPQDAARALRPSLSFSRRAGSHVSTRHWTASIGAWNRTAECNDGSHPEASDFSWRAVSHCWTRYNVTTGSGAFPQAAARCRGRKAVVRP